VRQEEIAPLLEKYRVNPADLTIIDITKSPDYQRYVRALRGTAAA